MEFLSGQPKQPVTKAMTEELNNAMIKSLEADPEARGKHWFNECSRLMEENIRISHENYIIKQAMEYAYTKCEYPGDVEEFIYLFWQRRWVGKYS